MFLVPDITQMLAGEDSLTIPIHNRTLGSFPSYLFYAILIPSTMMGKSVADFTTAGLSLPLKY